MEVREGMSPTVLTVGPDHSLRAVAQLMSEWFPYIMEQLPKWSIIPRAGQTPLVLAKYRSDAGVVGAAALCFSEASVSVPA